MMKLQIRLVFFLSIFSACMFGQRPVTTSELLATALTEQARSAQAQQLNFIAQTDNQLPWVDKMEVRTETDEMDIDRQEFLFRLSLNSQEERVHQNKLNRQNIQLLELEQLIVLQEALLDQYSSLVKYFHLKKTANLLAEQKLVANDQLQVLRRMATSSADFNLTGFITAEDNFHKLEQDIFELENRIFRLESEMKNALQANGELDFDTSNLLTINDLQQIIGQLPASPNANPSINRRQARVERSIVEYDLEEAQTQKVLDFVQLKYAGRDNLTFGQEWSFGMGFNIPTKNSQKLDLNELMLERIENESRVQLLSASLEEKLADTRLQFEFLLEKHALATRQFADSQLNFSLENYSQLADADPLALLRMKEIQLKREEDILEIEEDIFLTYLDLLDLTGAVVDMPLRNYLSANLEVIGN